VDYKDVAIRCTDIGRVIENYDSSVLGNNYRTTLPTSKIVRLLVSLQGQDIIRPQALESIAFSDLRINPIELKKTYLPIFQEWGFVRIYDNKIEENVKTRTEVLERAGRFWEENEPHEVEKLSLTLFDKTATAPRNEDEVGKVLSKFTEPVVRSAAIHLKESGLTDTFSINDTKWYYSPEIFGFDYNRTVKYIANLQHDRRNQVYSAITSVTQEQGAPHSMLTNVFSGALLDEVVGCGLLMGYPLALNGNSQTFYFTPDLRNRFDKVGRGDKFEVIKAGVAHFEYALRLATPSTGRLSMNPSVILDRLISNGRAGRATAIGTDYELLVKKGLVGINVLSGGRYEFILPDSKEKIDDLIAIKEAFETQTMLPTSSISEENMGLKGDILQGDSIVYRSKRALQAKELTKQLMEEMYHL
jgi:hypothetical protein